MKGAKSSKVYTCEICGTVGHQRRNCAQRYNVVVVGDSHTRVWEHLRSKEKSFWMVVHRATAMSAQGLTNPNSKTQAGVRFPKMVAGFAQKNERVDAFVFMAGSVDLDFVIFYKLAKHFRQGNEKVNNSGKELSSTRSWIGGSEGSEVHANTTNTPSSIDFDDWYKRQIERSTKAIFEFLTRHIEPLIPCERIYINGIHPPPLSDASLRWALNVERTDGQLEEQTSTDHYPDALPLPTHARRTAAAAEFNRILSLHCQQRGYGFIDVWSAGNLIDPTSGIVRKSFTKPISTDVHIEEQAVAPHYFDVLHSLGWPIGCGQSSKSVHEPLTTNAGAGASRAPKHDLKVEEGRTEGRVKRLRETPKDA